MDGVAFYEFLHDTFQGKGEAICEGFTFQGWAPADDGTDSLYYSEPDGTTRSDSRDVLINAWDSSEHKGETLLVENDSSDYAVDSRMELLDHLVKMCGPLRTHYHKHA
jgi:hypothetical protein